MPIGIFASIAAHLALFGLFVLVLLGSHKPYQAVPTAPVMVDLVPQSDLTAKIEEKSAPAEKEKAIDPQPPAEQPAQATGALAPNLQPMMPPTVAPTQPPVAPPKPVQAPAPPQQEAAEPKEQPPASANETDVAQPTPAELEKEREAAAFRLAKHYGAILVIPDSPVGGPPSKSSAKFSGSEIAALKAHLDKCWVTPAGIAPNEHLMVTMRVSLSPKGILIEEPSLIQASASRHGPALVKSAEQALKNCQPYSVLPAKKYKDWKNLDLNFSPRGLSSG